MTKVIGKVSATESSPSTIDEFYFWTDKKKRGISLHFARI